MDTSGDGLRHAVQEGVFLIKPNLGELSSLAGKEELSIHEAGLIAKDMINKGGCEVMIISMGQSGAMLVTGEASSILTAPQVVRKARWVRATAWWPESYITFQRVIISTNPPDMGLPAVPPPR